MNLTMKGLLTLLMLIAPSAGFAAQCTITDVSVAFGSYDPISPQPRDSNATLQVRCSGANETVSFQLFAATGAGSLGDRRASNGKSALRYNLFLDAGRTQIWGDGSSGTTVLSDSLTITDVPVTKTYVVYGRILAQQSYTTPGNYGDQLVITLNY